MRGAMNLSVRRAGVDGKQTSLAPPAAGFNRLCGIMALPGKQGPSLPRPGSIGFLARVSAGGTPSPPPPLAIAAFSAAVIAGLGEEPFEGPCGRPPKCAFSPMPPRLSCWKARAPKKDALCELCQGCGRRAEPDLWAFGFEAAPVSVGRLAFEQ